MTNPQNAVSMRDRIASIVDASIETKRGFLDAHTADVIRAAEIITATFRNSGKLLLCGNGGSAADAQHIAGEFVNRFLGERPALPALALATDGGVLTCIGNDTHFDEIFARQIEAFGCEGDVLLAISTSGTSPNIVRAAEQARGKNMRVIGLLGRDGGHVRELCDPALVVESSDTPRIQETHNLIGHIICELVESALFPAKQKD